MKRFWRAVTVAADEILLDGRPVRTRGRAPLRLPAAALAEAVAEEWRAVGDTLDPRAMPLTGLANASIDRVLPDPVAFAAGLAAYGESDLLCYRAEAPAALVARQAAAWDPLLDWAARRYDVAFVVTAGVIHRPQPPATIAALAAAIGARPAWTLAPLSQVVTITGSLVAALALAEGAADAERVWTTGRLDEDWQTELWGEEPEAARARASRRRDFDAAVRFLALLAE